MSDKEYRPLDPLLRNHEGRLVLHRSPEINYILDMALDEAMRMVKARHANFYLFNENGSLYAYNTSMDNPEAAAVSRYCIDNRTSLNLSKDRLPPIAVNHPTICVYLGLQEGDLGALVIQDPIYFKKFYEAELSLIHSFAATFSILLKNARSDLTATEIFLNFKSSLLLLLENAHLNQKVKESHYELKAVLEVSNMINSSRELNEMIQAVLYSARKVTRAESASLFLVDEKTGELYFDIISGENEDRNLKGMRIPQGQGIAGISALEKRSIIVNNAQSDPRVYRQVDEVSQMTTRNILASPLIVGEITIGVIEVINTIDRPDFTEHDLEIFESFSDSVAIALQRRRLLDDLQRTNLQLEKRLRELTSLHSVAGSLVDAKSVEDLFRRVLGIIRSDLNVGRASILLYNAVSQRLDIAAKEGDFNQSQEDEFEQSLSSYVYESRQPVFIEDFNLSDALVKFARPGRYNTRSCILIPMISSSDNTAYGVLCVTEPTSGRFYQDDYRILNTIASQLMRGYENFRLTEQILTKKAIEKEVEITSKIQQNILPYRMPEHLHLDMAAKSVMAKTTGGDFYDYYVHSPNGEVTLLVADVSGKSLPAALFMAISSSILRTIVRSESDPTRILALSNDLLYEESESGMFVTVFLARYEPGAGMLRFASAGHNDMLLMHRDGNYSLLSGKGSPLGVLPGYRQKYRGGEARISEGDTLILYTDGVIEAINSKNEEFGMDRFIELLRQSVDKRPAEIIDLVYNEVLAFAGSELQFDDFTMLVARFHGTVQGVKDYHITLPARVESIPALRDFVMQICQRHGLSGQDLEDVLLVSDEAATNIVVHAYQDTVEENPSFECDLQIESNNFVRLLFRDHGRPFRPEEVRDPDLRENLAGKRKGGFGVYLIRSLMNTVEYSRREGVNYLVAEKLLRGNNA